MENEVGVKKLSRKNSRLVSLNRKATSVELRLDGHREKDNDADFKLHR